MSLSPELDRLAARWADQPASTCFAPLAEGLRKRGALGEAAGIAVQGVAARPEYLPGHLVLARIYLDQQQWHAAAAELRAALAIDPAHPVVLDALDRLAQRRGIAPGASAKEAAAIGDLESTRRDDGDGESAELVYSDEIIEEAPGRPHELVVTESMAMLYWGQGHHQQAIEAFDALIRRHPGNLDLVARREVVQAEFEASRPAPFDAATSGGRGVRDWLASLAAVSVQPPQPVSGFDAFYQTPVVTPASPEPSDLAAFQAWLRELDR